MVTEKKRRSRYTSVACERCQQRKTRCSGEQPCNGCRKAYTRCLYPRATRYRSSRCVSAKAPLQEPETVQSEKESMEDGSESLDSLGQSWPLEAPGSELTYDNFGDFIRLTERQLFQADHQSSNSSANPCSGGFVSRELDMLCVQGRISPRGALEALDQSFWCRILAIYEEEVGMMYPFLDIHQLSHEIIDGKTRSGFDCPPSSSLYSEGVGNIAFLVLAIVSSFEGSKAVEIASPVVEEAFVSTIPKIHLQSPDLGDLTLLALTCIFFFLNDREKEAWRTISTIVRLVHEQSSQEEEATADKISDTFFWSLYTLDRRWSFGTGLPFAVQDSEINRPSLPMV
ncbi:hypothetical protein BFJ65_g4122 [Fusarium oxysporum f. sp. cepae]|uniref:Zn(2)-C6 fungal-type domain-containing protein n=1 Tax=Fusarium oxysporum f. sp. cepae TaxID=396571 RepID=A0A3L6P241_FUSOX|nr:hypothetical protein BFJ65_g4122 [Fusarium oxysporum f. sp. cepae]